MTTQVVLPVTDGHLECAALPFTEPERAVVWDAGWTGDTVSVRGIEHLSVLVSALTPLEFGGVRREGDPWGRWAQTKRMRRGWLVEIGDCSGDGWPSRAYRGPAGTYLREVVPGISFGPEYFSPGAAVDIMWAWLRGGLPEGIAAARAVD